MLPKTQRPDLGACWFWNSGEGSRALPSPVACSGKSDVSTPSGGFLSVKALLGAEDFAYVSLGSGQDGASGTQEEV